MTFIGTQGPTLSYTTTKNGYAVATATSSITLTADNISTRYVTQFLISEWNGQFELSYTINPNSTGPGGGGNYNSGKINLINSVFGIALTAIGIPLYFYFKKKYK